MDVGAGIGPGLAGALPGCDASASIHVNSPPAALNRLPPTSDLGPLPLMVVGWPRIAAVVALELINDAQSEIVVLQVRQICISFSPWSAPPPISTPSLPLPLQLFLMFYVHAKEKT